MAVNAAEVSNAKPLAAGGIFSAPLGTELPTNAVDPLPSAAVNYGYASDEGLSNSFDISNENFTAWGGDTVLTVRTSYEETFSFQLIQTNGDVMAALHGEGNVVETASGLTVFHTSKDLDYRVWVFEVELTGNRVKRIVVPEGKVTDREDVNHQDGGLLGYGVTLSTRPVEIDVDGTIRNGVTAIEYIALIDDTGGDSGN